MNPPTKKLIYYNMDESSKQKQKFEKISPNTEKLDQITILIQYPQHLNFMTTISQCK